MASKKKPPKRRKKVDPPIVVRSEGQRLLLEVEATVKSIAASCGVTHPAVIEWKYGRKIPGGPARAALWNAYGIPAPAWGRLPATLGGNGNGHAPGSNGHNGHVTPPAAASTSPATPTGLTEAAASAAAPNSIEDARALLGQIRLRASSPDLLPSDAVRLADSEAKILALLHRMQKEQDLLEDRIVREHPAWRRTRDALARVLSHHPAAAAEVAAELERLGM